MFRQAVKDGFGNPHGSGKHLNSRSFRLLNFGGSATASRRKDAFGITGKPRRGTDSFSLGLRGFFSGKNRKFSKLAPFHDSFLGLYCYLIFANYRQISFSGGYEGAPFFQTG
ncbi:MAG: hypothetical protein IJG60_04140 [Thermoguttaceae bacterium]|nr:hypothetical protein [Thermoguttaceae bacterium]